MKTYKQPNAATLPNVWSKRLVDSILPSFSSKGLLVMIVTDIISYSNLDRNHNKSNFSFWNSIQSLEEVFNLSLAKSIDSTRTEFILLPDFSKESIGKICILNSIHSLCINHFSGAKLMVLKSQGGWNILAFLLNFTPITFFFAYQRIIHIALEKHN